MVFEMQFLSWFIVLESWKLPLKSFALICDVKELMELFQGIVLRNQFIETFLIDSASINQSV